MLFWFYVSIFGKQWKNWYGILHHRSFIDFKAAYESMPRMKLYMGMVELSIPIRLIRLALTNVRGQINAEGSLSRPFYINIMR